MKVVINSCYGLFSLSVKGIEYYLALKWKNAYWYKAEICNAPHRRIPSEEATNREMCFTEDNWESFVGNWVWYFSCRDIERNDPDLVKTVKALKKEANWMCAELKVVTIPDWVEYTIEEYDWYEHIAEKHRTWY